MIVACAIQFASQGNEVNIVADDTDVLILLIYHWNHNITNIYYQKEDRKAQMKCLMAWKIRNLASKGGIKIRIFFLFIRWVFVTHQFCNIWARKSLL